LNHSSGTSAGKNFYQILDLSLRALQAEIKAQYRLLVHAWHPDKFPAPDQKAKAGENMMEINAAYAVLEDPSKRAESDRRLGVPSSSRPTATAGARAPTREPKRREPPAQSAQRKSTQAETEHVKQTKTQDSTLLLLRQRWLKVHQAINEKDKPVGALTYFLVPLSLEGNALRL
jgi:DnaJ-class molecular chaperone